MTSTSPRVFVKPLRGGWTITEVLVALTVIGIMASLAIPAVLGIRESARRVQCQSNLRGIALSVQSFSDVQCRYPAMAYHHRSIDVGYYRNWVVEILPWIGETEISQAWDNSRFNWEPSNDRLAAHPIPGIVCPSDDSVIAGRPDLSYVVNGGYGWSGIHTATRVPRVGAGKLIDYNGNGIVGAGESAGTSLPSDKSLYFNTSLFFLGIWPHGSDVEVAKHTPASVHDGLSNTLMISENVRAGFDSKRINAMGWASTLPSRIAFFVSMYVCNDLVCREGQVDYARANGSQFPATTEALNSSINQPEGTPWPSSLHGDGVNFAFCDGRVKFISESIDGAVYAALASPQGLRIRGPLYQIVPGDSDY